jgi:cobalt-zinc-cadmium efflux system protein
MEPEQPNATGMMYFAIAGVLVNGYAAWRMSSGKSLNERVVSWHFLEDVLGWAAVLVVAIILQFRQIPYLDPGLSLLITLYILFNVLRRLRETLLLFLQGVPPDISIEQIEQAILKIPEVHSLHHTHVWSLDGEKHVFSTHVKLNPVVRLDKLAEVKRQIKERLKKYPFEHYTIETELADEDCQFNDKAQI